MAVTWITGASSGLGRALALRVARRPGMVVASARGAAALDELVRETGDLPGNLVAMPLDVTDVEAVGRTVADIEARCGDIDTAVLAAGTHKPMVAQEFDAGALRDLLEVNVMGVAYALQALLPRMIARGTGRIAVVSSVAGYRGLPSSAAYGASKAALINMCEALKFDLDKTGVRIQLIDPGFVRTPLTDRNPFRMPFLMDPEEAAERMVRGLASPRFEITFPKRFTWQLKLLRILPYALYFPLVRRITGW